MISISAIILSFFEGTVSTENNKKKVKKMSKSTVENTTKKYEITNETHPNKKNLKRIRALKDFSDVKKGDLGGFIESEKNLSHEGDCWVYGNAAVGWDARVSGNAKVFGDAVVFWDARVSGNAEVSGDASVFDNAKVSEDAVVSWHAVVRGEAEVSGNARVWGHSKVFGNA